VDAADPDRPAQLGELVSISSHEASGDCELEYARLDTERSRLLVKLKSRIATKPKLGRVTCDITVRLDNQSGWKPSVSSARLEVWNDYSAGAKVLKSITVYLDAANIQELKFDRDSPAPVERRDTYYIDQAFDPPTGYPSTRPGLQAFSIYRKIYLSSSSTDDQAGFGNKEEVYQLRWER
jgi:hypothetical protein